MWQKGESLLRMSHTRASSVQCKNGVGIPSTTHTVNALAAYNFGPWP